MRCQEENLLIRVSVAHLHNPNDIFLRSAWGQRSPPSCIYTWSAIYTVWEYSWHYITSHNLVDPSTIIAIAPTLYSQFCRSAEHVYAPSPSPLVARQTKTCRIVLEFPPSPPAHRAICELWRVTLERERDTELFVVGMRERRDV